MKPASMSLRPHGSRLGAPMAPVVHFRRRSRPASLVACPCSPQLPRHASTSREPWPTPPVWGTVTDHCSISPRLRPHMPFTDRDLEYLEGVHPPLGPVLEEILKAGRSEKVPIVSPSSGRLLHVLVMAMAP